MPRNTDKDRHAPGALYMVDGDTTLTDQGSRRPREPTPVDATRRFQKRHKHVPYSRKPPAARENNIDQLKAFKPHPKITTPKNYT
jgi:hypothetical protein